MSNTAPLRDLLVQILEACPVPYVVQDDAKEALARLDEAVRIVERGVEDLLKAANQFEGLGYQVNARRFGQKAEELRAALAALVGEQ